MSRVGLRNDAAFLSRLFMVCEALIVLFGLLVSHRVFFEKFTMLPEFQVTVLVTLIMFNLTYTLAGMYKTWRGIRIRAEFRKLVACWVVIVAGASSFVFLSKAAEVVSRLWFGWGIVIGFVLVCAFRFAVRIALSKLRRQGFNSRSVVFVGAERRSSDVIKRLFDNPWIGLNPVAMFDDTPELQGEQINGVPIMGKIDDLYSYIEQRRISNLPIDQVWIAATEKSEPLIEELMIKMEDTSVDVRLIPNFYGVRLSVGLIDEVADIPVVNMSKVRKDNVSELVKPVMDYLFSLLAVILLSPLMVLIALAIVMESRGGVIFKQRRYGVDGQEILVWKFRTMTVTENGNSVKQATRNDNRVTRIGRLLRRTSLDELPQFFNVLAGNMSVVGPRPHAVIHNEEYRRKIRGYMGRHKIKPGITGWAQVNGFRGETDTLDKMKNRVKYDIDYINNWSIWLDVKIVFLTIVRGFVNKSAY